MKIFKIYKLPSGDIKTVKDGWSWPGFFFVPLWAIYHRLWKVIFFTLGIAVFLGVVFAFLNIDPTNLELSLDLIAKFIFGFFGNTWRESLLENKGFQYQESIEAKSPAQAYDVYMKTRLAKFQN